MSSVQCVFVQIISAMRLFNNRGIVNIFILGSLQCGTAIHASTDRVMIDQTVIFGGSETQRNMLCFFDTAVNILPHGAPYRSAAAWLTVQGTSENLISGCGRV